VAHVMSMVVASTVVSLNAVNVPAGSLVAVSTVGNLSAVNIPAGSLVAANIPAGSMVEASIVNVTAMVSIATERERQRCAPCHKLSSTSRAGEPLSPRQDRPKIDCQDLPKID
jgi:antitoxin component of MazEF toxin-antitoxin module